ncbi:MAG: LacI family DNA-binding transcriptional regulator [Oscillospiraceae bacterium]|nr:LacI family DNA-binding transcriptional regulator [Oscillospiraceae bacterium]
MKITIKDVAKEAKVSVTTVSRVINKNTKVSSATVKKVSAAMKKLGYCSAQIGKSPRKSRSQTIMAIIPSIDNPLFGDVLRGMRAGAAEHEYEIIACVSSDSITNEQRLLSMLSNHAAEAAVILGTQLDKDKLNELSKDFYIALCCEYVEGADVLAVTVDDSAGAYYATRNFINMGHTKIAIVSTKTCSSSSKEREKGYLKALKESGIEFREEYIFRGGYNYNNGADAFNTFMSLSDSPTAVFCVSDILALGFANQAIKADIKIGVDISICGFDNIPFSGMHSPGITTIEQPGFEIGRTAVEELIYRIHNGVKSSRHITLNFELISRDSIRSLNPSKPPTSKKRKA